MSASDELATGSAATGAQHGSPADLAAEAPSHRFALPGGGQAIFTTRQAGNLSIAAGTGHEQGLAARKRLCDALGLDWLCAGPQVHGTVVRRVRGLERQGGEPSPESADGHATALSGVGVMVLAADCVPVVLGAQGAVAAVHAGWRGLAAGVLEEGVAALRELSASGEIHAVIGPCAGACCYEVGAEVLQSFAADLATEPSRHQSLAGGEPPSPATGSQSPPSAGVKAKLDLRALARRRLLAAGVDGVSDLDVCTICDEGMFSHRREGLAAGRQAAVAWLP